MDSVTIVNNRNWTSYCFKFWFTT